MASIAIIGTERCGKTVLVTTLAMRLQSPDERGVFIEPITKKTKTYVEKSWRQLNDCDWPEVTAPGVLNELLWRLHAGEGVQCDVKLVDCAGHDLRALFADEQINERDKLPGALQQVADYCRTADIVLFVANLGDFLSEENTDRLVGNQWAVKFGMDHVRRNGHNRHCCLLFTQVDKYDQIRQECSDWLGVAKKYLPDVYAAHVHDAAVPIFPVAAVADTTEKHRDGKRFVVPQVGFTSMGLQPFVDWLADKVRQVVKQRDREETERRLIAEQQKRAAAAEQERQRIQDERERKAQERKRQWDRLGRLTLYSAPGGVLAGTLVFFLTLYPCLGIGRWIQPIIETTVEGQDLIHVDFFEEKPVYEMRSSGMWWWYKEWKEQVGTEWQLQKTEFFKPSEVPKADGKRVVHRGVKHTEARESKVVGTRNMWFWAGILPFLLSLLLGLAFATHMWWRRVEAGA